MPYIAVNVTRKLSEKEILELKTELGRTISLLPGKLEKNLMINIEDGKTLFFGGETMDVGAFLDVRIFGHNEREDKSVYTVEVFSVIERVIGIPPSKVFITIGEYDTWGAHGKLIG